MPMYEKGSVRAGPRSKQQERMKKIMKKFLSSLLALTMILSLVIVPANAATGETTSGSPNTEVTGGSQDGSVNGGSVSGPDTTPEPPFQTQYRLVGDVTVSVTGNKTSVKGGEKVTFTATNTVKVQKQTTKDGEWVDTDNSDNVVYTCKWSGDGISERESSTNPLEKSWEAGQSDARKTATYTVTATVGGTAVSGSKFDSASVTVKAAPTLTIKANDATVTDSNTVVEILKGGKLELTAEAAGVNNPDYRWIVSTDVKSTSSTYSVSTTSKTDSDVTVTCNVYEGEYNSSTNSTPAVTATCKYKIVEEDLRWNVTPTSKSVTLTKKGATQTVTATLQKKADNNTWNNVNGLTYSFDCKSGVVSLSNKNTSAGSVTVTLQNEGDVTLTVSTMYKGANQSVDIKVSGELLSASLGEVKNGNKLDFDYDDLEALANKVLPRGVDVKSGGYITIENYPTRASEGGTLYVDSKKQSGTRISLGSRADLTFASQAGFIGDANLELTVTGDDNQSYTVYVTIPVTPAGEIKDTVTGTSANKEVTFTNDDYDYLYYSYSKPTYKDYFDGNKVSDFEGPVKEDKTVTVPASKFNSSKTVTLYVVGLDDDGVASTGTITVSQKSYDINYNVVAGKSVSFSQKDFESFLEDYAEDDGKYNPKKDDISFDHAVLTSSVPSTKNEGTLYDGSTEITSSNKSKTKMTDMDKVSFETVSKPSKDTITLTFKVYGEVEKPNSRKPDEVKYDVNVVINVVKEDITYTVGIDDTVQLTARDFVNFLQDAKTSYRKAELDYVKFDVSGKNVSSYAYGGLYRSYSSYSTGKLADSTDKFYYEPSRTQYDLADVAYHTTRWAEAGKTVYIPFTVYGTKNEEASGTMAITIAQTMNFIDVKASDFFYEPVKWAVNNKITNGTSSTTFSPYKNCNRAEIVTFLWRAAGTPEPTVTRNPFTDVNSVRDASYYKAILWASQKGITAGTNATTFSPYQECTRSQIVTFLYRYAGKPSGYYTNPFKDVSSVNEASYYNAILWASGKGITTGSSPTTFSPYASCTRGEAVTFLYRYVNGVK